MKIPLKKILDVVAAAKEPLPFREIMGAFGVSKAERRRLILLVDELVEQGELVKLKGNRYTLVTRMSTISGKISLHRDGYGFLSPDSGGEDLYIPARYLRESMQGDRVEVAQLPPRHDGKREGRIVRTLERGVHAVVGIYRELPEGGLVVTSSERPSSDLHIPATPRTTARNGEMVVARITTYPAEGRGAVGRITEVLGRADDPQVEALAIIRKHGLPDTFPPDALAEAVGIARGITADDLQGRTDLRGITTVTIDGETARDFDDAVGVTREPGDLIRLRVSIADVSHYVKPGSALDREAYLRGTSVYFPDRCLPMLPEELSNGICSLVPGQERLTLTAELLFGRDGDLQDARFYPSVIRSNARLTYTLVEQIVVAEDREARAAHESVVPDLMIMKELALRLTALRWRRGSIDFDLPEPEIIMNLQGEIQDIVRSKRLFAHRIIEEFMLAANEAVATAIAASTIPSLYRIHEPPDPGKIAEFREFVYNFGYRLPGGGEESLSPADLQRLLDEVEGRPEERMINEVLLRCMKQARYSAEQIGHFGLASPCYTHFTSPIRRYPDLVIHRILRKLLAGPLADDQRQLLQKELPETAAHTSRRERVAMEAEREIVNLRKAEFMQSRVGEEYDGIITGVTTFGFFVELTPFFVEGMVPVAMLRDDYYQYLEKEHVLLGSRSGQRFRIGDPVRITVSRVDLERRRIEFALAGTVGVNVPREAVGVRSCRKRPLSGVQIHQRSNDAAPGQRKGKNSPGGRGRR
jgi:ribonuclease R